EKKKHCSLGITVCRRENRISFCQAEAWNSRSSGMPASLEQISDNTPMGANLIGSGATFRVWAPHAHRVHACVNGAAADESNLLTANEAGYWCGFLPGVQDRDRYKFFVVGDGGSGPRRDPFAREVAAPFPDDCVIRATDFPWHETGYVTPQFHD